MTLPAAERESEAPHIEWRAWRTSGRAVLLDLSIGPSVVPLLLGSLMPGMPAVGSSLRMVGIAACMRPRMALSQDFGKHFLDVPAL